MHENLNELERSLALLVPAAARIDRDQVLYRAGQESAARRVRVWQMTTLLCALVGAGVIVAWGVQPTPEPTVRVVHVPAPAPDVPAPLPPPSAILVAVADASPPLGSGYLARQRQVLRWGLDGLEGLPPEAGRARSAAPAVEVPRGNSSRSKLFARWPFPFRGDD